ncbi:efflux transporter outer membrane subunit [Rubellicoccus peritrichatus]|uniref:Efflux transporter outer membrane subunit n=1 Tax=Rubellicoccus peritrichatus TaxID=3080537 RepID=A0AAQ3L898_9BACT|nr:efflux transporter outer membrane subunit [Puniceicoccus sp. CR14]WOO39759.1 efflux transporter outer membrane subunit [Puniceicoccus sp. CR14]
MNLLNPSLQSNSRCGKPTLLAVGLLCLTLLTSCTVGPDYEKPVETPPVNYRYGEAADSSELVSPEWWLAYSDVRLNELIDQAMAQSPTLAAALARVDRAAATIGVARSELFPQVDFFTSAARDRVSGNTGGFFSSPNSRNEYSTSLGLAWEIDMWGRVRRLTDAAVAETEAEVDAYAYALVLLQSNVAEAYFRVLVIDRSIGILEKTVAGRLELLELAEIRQRSGLGDDLELAQARTEWATAVAELEAFRRERAISENALAVLTGNFPDNLTITPNLEWEPSIPASPIVVPSDLLERRPDIAEAERLVAAASEIIGARIAEYYPRIQINGNVGFAASDASSWFTRNALFGSLGPSLELPLLTGDLTKSRVEQAKAEYSEILSLYREQVLEAFRGVEDALASLLFLKREIASQSIAAEAADTAARLARQRFESGLVNYLEVIDTERISLTTNLRLNQIRGEQIAAQLELIRNLGGGWKSDDIGEDESQLR